MGAAWLWAFGAYAGDVAGGDEGAERGEVVVHEAPPVALHGDVRHPLALGLLGLPALLRRRRGPRAGPRPLPPPLGPAGHGRRRRSRSHRRLRDAALEQVEVGDGAREGLPLAPVMLLLLLRLHDDARALEQRQEGHLRRRHRGAGAGRLLLLVRPLFHYRHRGSHANAGRGARKAHHQQSRSRNGSSKYVQQEEAIKETHSSRVDHSIS